MRTVNINKKFSCAGCEPGKHLAKDLSIPCYSNQIIDMIAKKGSRTNVL